MMTPSGKPQWRGRQFHYLSADSHVHPFLVDLWNEVREKTDGRLEVTVYPANEGLKGSHLDIVQKMADGEIEFYVLMGGILGGKVPALEIQGLPFVFKDHAQVHRVFDGPLGEHLRDVLLPHGIVALPFGLMENGFRHISTVDRPVRTVDDLAGQRIRIPEGKMFADAFRSLGAEPMPVYVLEMYKALAERRVDGQENPLAVTDALKLHEVTRHVSLTFHMWSGFNMMAGRGFWERLPQDVQEIVLAAVKRHVARQRAHTDQLNRGLETTLAERGMTIIRPARETFRSRLIESGFYRRWREILGEEAWTLLEKSVGSIA
jgi:tripartite ATP-independent transporter DctP family solute receptor